MNQFSHYVGIDYSGAAQATTRSKTIQVYQAADDSLVEEVPSLATNSRSRRNWNRQEVFEWLLELFQQKSPVIVGMDHGFSFPLSYFHRHQLSTWDDFLQDFAEQWPEEPTATVDDFRRKGLRQGDAKELRVTEQWTSSAKSVFQFDVQGSVAKSTHAGLPFLYQLRQALSEVHFWPFDGWSIPAKTSVIAEIYPSLFRNRYPRKDRTPDQQDAYAVCRWLMEMDSQFGMERFLEPPLSTELREQARLEGWILGVT